MQTTTIQQTNRLTRYFRISRVAVHTLVGVATVSLIFPLIRSTHKINIMQWWHGRLLAALNVQITTHGNAPQAMAGILVVANHISWLDIHALNSVVPLRFIAKSEIKHWPIFGYLAKSADVLFIDRDNRKDAVRVAHTTANSLAAGDNLCLFPEGTTTDGSQVLPFKSSLIQAALHANATLHPVAIRYPLPNGDINTMMAYAGDTSLKTSLNQILSLKKSEVELHFLSPICIADLPDKDKNRRVLSARIEKNIREKLDL